MNKLCNSQNIPNHNCLPIRLTFVKVNIPIRLSKLGKGQLTKPLVCILVFEENCSFILGRDIVDKKSERYNISKRAIVSMPEHYGSA